MSSQLVTALVLVALFVGAMVVVVQAKDRRSRQLKNLAVQREWRFVGDDDSVVSGLRGEPFGSTRDHACANVIEGSFEGRPFHAFDFSYRVGRPATGSGRSTCSMVALQLGEGVRAPSLGVVPQAAWGSFLPGLADDDARTGDPAFDDRHRIRTEDAGFAVAVLHPELRQLLLASPSERSWLLEGDALMVYQRGGLTPVELDYAVRVGAGIIAYLPAEAWSRMRGHR